MGIHVPIRRCLLSEKRRSWSNDINAPLIPDIAWVEVHSWKIDKTPLTIVQRNDSDSCKSACLKYPGCITAGWKRNTSDCSLHSYTRLRASMRYWIPAPDEDYFEFYFTPLGKGGCCNQLYQLLRPIFMAFTPREELLSLHYMSPFLRLVSNACIHFNWQDGHASAN